MGADAIFRPSFGNRPDRLVGREEVINQILSGLESFPGSQERAPIILGQRGMGKTALLLVLADQAEAHGFICARTTCGDTMLGDLLDQLQYTGAKYVSDKKKSIQGFNAGVFGFSFGLSFTEEAHNTLGFRTKLEMICDRLEEAGKGVLLILDEATPTQPHTQTLVKAYQELAGIGKNIALVMACLPSAVSEVLTTKTLTFLSRAQRVGLGPLSIAEVEAYYSIAFKRANRDVPSELVKQAAQATGGIPYLLQLIGYYLLSFSGEGDKLTTSQLEQAKEAAREDFETKVFQAILKELSSGDMAFLRAMAQDAKSTQVADLEQRLGVTQGTVQTYRRRLLDAGVIEAPRRGELSFAMPQLAEYLSS